MAGLPEDPEIEQVIGLEGRGRENDRPHANRNRPEATPLGSRGERSAVQRMAAATRRREQGRLLPVIRPE
jgi:hypothetical protein